MTTYPYLGVPGALRQLTGPNGQITDPASRGEQPHGLLSGGTGMTRRLNEKRTWTAPYTSILASGTADLLSGFAAGLYGDGPFLFVNPDYRNALPMDVASVGLRSQAAHGWTASAGTLAKASGSPVDGSGVLTWTTPTTNATLNPTVVVDAPGVLGTAAAYMPGEPVAVSLWVKASGAATANLEIAGYDATGAYLASVSSPVALTTAWQAGPFATVAGAGNATLASAVYVLPRLKITGTAPASVSIAAGQLEYSLCTTAWQRGYGSPRVLITAPVGRSVVTYGWSDHTLTLAEV